MTIYHCRFIKPTISGWVSVVASSPEEAALTYHDNNHTKGYLHHIVKSNGGREAVRFALIEIENHKTIITRMFTSGIWRKGAIKPKDHRELQNIADKLEWKGTPNDLIATNWELEESYV